MGRMKLRKKHKINKITFIFIAFLLVLVSTIWLIHFISTILTPAVFTYAEMEMKKVAAVIVTSTINDAIKDKIEVEELFRTTKNQDEEIQSVDFNTNQVNVLLSDVTSKVLENLKLLENGNISFLSESDQAILVNDPKKLKKGIVYEIPFGAITDNVFIANLGPKIPVRLRIIGAVVGNINTSIKEYGINSAMLEVSIHVELTEQLRIPVISKPLLVSLDVPVAMKIIQGRVPEYYSSTGLNSSSPLLSLPIEEAE